MNLMPLSAATEGEGLSGLDRLARHLSDATLGVRPEHMRLIDGEAAPPEELVADLTVEAVEVVGAESYVYGALPGGENVIAVRVPGYSRLEPGTRVRAAAPYASIHRFDPGSGRRI